MLALADLKKSEVFYDLGSGDGRTVIMAAREFGAKAVGVELREDLAKKALSAVHELGIEDQVTIVQNDLFNVDVSPANVIFLYLTTSANDKVRPKLEKELQPGTRVISHDYEILAWKPMHTSNFCENPRLGYPSHTIYIYRK
jgi:tRNA A58 N-methylase Trm61